MSLRGSEAGYALLDAVVALLVTALAAGAVLSSLALAARHAGRAAERAHVLVEERNADALERMGMGDER